MTDDDLTGPYGTALPLRWHRRMGRLTAGQRLVVAKVPDVVWCDDDASWWPMTVAGVVLHARYLDRGARALCVE